MIRNKKAPAVEMVSVVKPLVKRVRGFLEKRKRPHNTEEGPWKNL
jgi:hypothetical protein